MIFSRATFFLAAAAVIGVVHSQDCPSNDNGQCDFEPTNPFSCGPDYECGYSSLCLAEAAGYNVDTDCCQAPQPSGCPMLYEPLVCGSKKCPYTNLCVAELAGYSSSQCSPPAECPTGTFDCSYEPDDPFICGVGNCEYRTRCDADSAGFDTRRGECCQVPTTGTSACITSIEPVSCGLPGEKQCSYANQCLAESVGFSADQCCRAVPQGIVCNSIVQPVECGDIPCVYTNQCEATAAGYSQSECCPQPVSTGCNRRLDRLACGTARCVYDNACIARNAGFDPASCVALPPLPIMTIQGDTNVTGDVTSGAAGKTATAAGIAAFLFAAVLNLV